MAVKTFRYRREQAAATDRINALVPGTATLIGVAGGNVVDYSFEENNISDLDDAMARLGFTNIATDPVDSALSSFQGKPSSLSIDFVEVDTNSATYELVQKFIFHGSTNVGSPVAIKAIGFVSTAGPTGQIRVFDFTNSLVIAESATFSDLLDAIIDLGTISNVPANQAVWEIQHKRASGSGNQRTHIVSASMCF